MLERAFCPNTISFAAIVIRSLFDNREDVFLAENQVLFPIDFDFAAGILGEQHLVSRLELDLSYAAVLEQLAGPDRHHLRLDRLFLRGIWNVEPTGGALLLRQPLDQNSVVKWPNFHCYPPLP